MDITTALQTIIAGDDLEFAQARTLFDAAMAGELGDIRLAALLTALAVKGETPDELAGATAAMRDVSKKVPLDLPFLVDTCGTGGSGQAKLFNISTAAAFVAAAAGANVAKHGNRAASSKSGSADMLEAAGVNLELTPPQIEQCIKQLGVGFMFARMHHSAMRHAVTVRSELGVRTLMNLLGPMTNPANAPNQLLGVFSTQWQKKMVAVLERLGAKRVMTVHSDGLDEISIDRPSLVVELIDGTTHEHEITPEQLGLRRRPIDDLVCDSISQSLHLVRRSLSESDSAAADIVTINAGAAICIAGVTNTLGDGVAAARDAIRTGEALDRFERLAILSQSFAVP